MKFKPTNIPDIVEIHPPIFQDSRGFFLVNYQSAWFEKAGLPSQFVQDNHSKSAQGTLRGLHYQVGAAAQGKLIRCIQGRIFDVGVDIRPGSKTYGKWAGVILDSERHNMLYIPQGFAHGFYVLSHTAEVEYKCTHLYAPQEEGSIQWNDPSLNIRWPLLPGDPILSEKDRLAPAFGQHRHP